MSVAVVSVVAFLLFLGITLGIPSLPPGDILYNFLGIPEITYSILGFSGKDLMNGILNGLFWGIGISIIYSLGRASKREVIFRPVAIPAPMQTTPLAIKSSNVRKIKTYVPLEQNIETIEGIGPTYGSRLRNSGVNVVGDLLILGSTRRGRLDLSDKIGVAPTTIFKWVNRADFFRIRGVGKQYSDLLESTGVNTVLDLSRRNPKKLYENLRETNREKNLVRRTPPLKMIEGWIQSAKKLKRMVKY